MGENGLKSEVEWILLHERGIWLGDGLARNEVLLTVRFGEGVCEAEKILLGFVYY